MHSLETRDILEFQAGKVEIQLVFNGSTQTVSIKTIRYAGGFGTLLAEALIPYKTFKDHIQK